MYFNEFWSLISWDKIFYYCEKTIFTHAKQSYLIMISNCCCIQRVWVIDVYCGWCQSDVGHQTDVCVTSGWLDIGMTLFRYGIYSDVDSISEWCRFRHQTRIWYWIKCRNYVSLTSECPFDVGITWTCQFYLEMNIDVRIMSAWPQNVYFMSELHWTCVNLMSKC